MRQKHRKKEERNTSISRSKIPSSEQFSHMIVLKILFLPHYVTKSSLPYRTELFCDTAV
jgi:hypothetical protein